MNRSQSLLLIILVISNITQYDDMNITNQAQPNLHPPNHFHLAPQEGYKNEKYFTVFDYHQMIIFIVVEK